VLTRLLWTILRFLLSLRYRIRIRGLDQIARRGDHSLLFLPNHPALIDPIILVTVLFPRFRPRPLADEEQVRRPVVHPLARAIGVIEIPDIKAQGAGVRDAVDEATNRCVAALEAGHNVLMYPSGHIYRTHREDLRGNSGAHDIARRARPARVILVRTRGLWGSGLSMADGRFPNLPRLIRATLLNTLRNLIFLAPRRPVTIEFFEPSDLPRDGERDAFNAYLEGYYNAGAPPRLDVARWWGDRPVYRHLPDPDRGRGDADLDSIPHRIRDAVLEHLRSEVDITKLDPQQRLAQDLGLDSLARAELLMWIAQEFGVPEPQGEAVNTVGDVLLAAAGEAVAGEAAALDPPPNRWFAGDVNVRLTCPDGDTLCAAFLAAARAHPGRAIVADEMRGTLTYRQVITACLVLKPEIERLPGEYVGILLPASVGATIVYWATLFAGKVPVMINWTTGARNMAHTLEIAGVQRVLTAQLLIQRLERQGTDFRSIRDVLVNLEDLGKRIGLARKLTAVARSYLSWAPLRRTQPAKTAVVLVTSGSESKPKAVPLTHENILTNIRDVVRVAHLRGDDRMMGFLPPFHSFGLTVTTAAPLVLGLPVVYHTNPTDAAKIVRLIEAYKTTLVLGTPTFLAGIVRAASQAQLASLRLAVTGAEKCPDSVYAAIERRCPQATVLEGYGITECSPIVAVNRPENPQAGTIGKTLPSVESVILDVDTDQPVEAGKQGMLLVRGPSIFGAYLGDDVASPFVEHAGHAWYRTGDLVSADADGVLTFRGRLKRFVKIGGEMVSLPAVEAALEGIVPGAEDEGPQYAVVATDGDGRPELVLFATQPVQRQDANERVRAAGLSGLHNITRVQEIPEIPQLGNGKTNYRALQDQLQMQ
jgi:acyl carrier protein